MTTTKITGKKRVRKPKEDPVPPERRKKLQKTLDSAPSTSNTVQNVKSSTVINRGRGKAKAPVKRKPREKKPVNPTISNRKTGPAKRKPRSAAAGEGKEEDEEVADLVMSKNDLAKDKEEDEEEEENPVAWQITRKIAIKDISSVCRLTGDPVEKDEAMRRWPHRYKDSNRVQHYNSAVVDGETFQINDCCYIQAAEGEVHYIGRIVEFFEEPKKKPSICVNWFYRPEDTMIAKEVWSDLVDSGLMSPKLLFASNTSGVNPLDCIVKKLAVVQASIKNDLPECDFYYNLLYSEEFCTFHKLSTGEHHDVASTSSTTSSKGAACDSYKPVMTLLDLYSGCGGMSTGLCMGASASNVDLVARWAVDYSEEACKSLRHNHPETEVRNGKAEDFLRLIKDWKRLCEKYSLVGTPYTKMKIPTAMNQQPESEEEANICPPDDNGEYEVDKILDICYGDPNETGKGSSLHFLVKWKEYGSSWNTWEPESGLKKCDEAIRDFVTEGYRSNKLPLPDTVDMVCGGPPCQGVSGFNRFRNVFADDKNSQLDVYMDIVDFLRPRFVLMENVMDILKFKKGYCGRYAVGRLVSLEYQVRLGFLVAGSFGLPQYRQRAFFWGAQTNETLPQFPVPTHKVIGRGSTPREFSGNLVKGDDNTMLDALTLGDAITDLPPILTHEQRDEMDYDDGPKTRFQTMIRLSKNELMGTAAPESSGSMAPRLYDHRPLKLSEDDNIRVSKIPVEKGANFRHLHPRGLTLNKKTNVVTLNKNVKRKYLRSGKPLIPDYAISFVGGKSRKPFARLWEDEIVNTVVTRAEPHNQAMIHPGQHRVLSIRENARLQGFPDFYQLFGTVKQRYMQVGNAVAVPVGRALGFALSNAVHGISDGTHKFELPPTFFPVLPPQE